MAGIDWISGDIILTFNGNSHPDSERKTGSVVWFDDSKGYGFICPEGEDPADKGKHVYIHYSRIMKKGWRSLVEGQRVEYSVETGPKGIYAVGVKVLQQVEA